MTPGDIIRLRLPAHGMTFDAWASVCANGRSCLRWVDTIETAAGQSICGWIYWPEWAAAGLLEDGPIVPGTYGDGPIYVTELGLQYRTA